MTSQQLTIMVVDDDSIAYMITKQVLKQAGLDGNIIWMENGQQALSYLQTHCFDNGQFLAEHCPDLILLDLKMPVMDGMEFLEALAAIGAGYITHQRIVILSSSVHAGDVMAAQRMGVRLYLDKPLTGEKIDRLRNMWP
jgi:CheY-like chemotaxis protein